MITTELDKINIETLNVSVFIYIYTPEKMLLLCNFVGLVIALGWQLQFFALHHFGNVKIEEITIKNRLYNASKDSDEVVVGFVHVTVDPVENVEASISPKSKQVVTRDCFSFTGF